jgi:hypothetical protein
LFAISIASIALFNLSNYSKVKLSEKVAFEEWKVKFGKQYMSDAENFYRFGIFMKNLIIINDHNKMYESG